MPYRTIGVHTRTEYGIFKIFPHDSLIEPTPLELAMFPNKFVYSQDVQIGTEASSIPAAVPQPVIDNYEPHKYATAEYADEEDTSDNIAAYANDVDALKAKINAIVASDRYDEQVNFNAIRLLNRNPERQYAIENLIDDMNKFLSELE